MDDSSGEAGFAGQLKRLRKEKNLKQKDAAEALGVSQSTIANYEQGIRFPDEEMLKGLAAYLNVTVDELLGFPGPSPEPDGRPVPEREELREMYRRSVTEGSFDQALGGLIEGINRGVPAREIFGLVIEPVLRDIGSRWENGEIDAIREHIYTEEIRKHIAIVTHYARRKPARGIRCAAASVGGEMHTLGLRMISDLLELEGFTVFYLGTNAPAGELVRMCIEESIDILALSVTMDYHLNSLSSLIGAVRSEPDLARMKIIAGGNAVNRNPEIWKTAGADGHSPGISSVLEDIERLVGSGG